MAVAAAASDIQERLINELRRELGEGKGACHRSGEVQFQKTKGLLTEFGWNLRSPAPHL